MSKAREEYDKLIKLFDTIRELKSEKAELIDILEKIRGLTLSKAVNNHLDQIYLISDIGINKFKKDI
jgi:hypothetical protein